MPSKLSWHQDYLHDLHHHRLQHPNYPDVRADRVHNIHLFLQWNCSINILNVSSIDGFLPPSMGRSYVVFLKWKKSFTCGRLRKRSVKVKWNRLIEGQTESVVTDKSFISIIWTQCRLRSRTCMMKLICGMRSWWITCSKNSPKCPPTKLLDWFGADWSSSSIILIMVQMSDVKFSLWTVARTGLVAQENCPSTDGTTLEVLCNIVTHLWENGIFLYCVVTHITT